ncbi:MAG: hypothetical protein JO222_09380 [Frankiales bacterium]|nr:hypothetical protein [Frankiales bacterium]
MQLSTRTLGRAAVGLAMGGLVVTGVPAAIAAPHTAPGTTITVAITRHNVYVDGPTTFPAGRLNVTLDSGRKNGATYAVVGFKTGYTFHDFRHDLGIAFQNLFAPNGNTKKGLKYLNKAINHSSGYGGYHADGLGESKSTLLLTTPGQYTLFDNSGNLPKRPVTLTVTAPVGPQTLAKAPTVIAKTNRRFAGPKVLPRKGIIGFRNNSTESPHFLILQHIKEGTTKKQIRQGLQSNSQPSWLLPESTETDVVSHGNEIRIHVNLPKGEYVEMCFFPDPQTGMPHALMGMFRIVHLK